MRIILPGGSGQVGTLLARSFTQAGHDVVVLTRHPARVHSPFVVDLSLARQLARRCHSDRARTGSSRPEESRGRRARLLRGKRRRARSDRPGGHKNRMHPPATAPWRILAWDGATLSSWADEFDGADVVINLAGRSVNCRYTPENRRQILESRVNSTRAVGQAIAAASRPPRVWLQASTATIYAHRFDASNDESSGLIGGMEPGAPDTWRFSIQVATAWERAAQEAIAPHTRQVLLRSAMTMSPDRGGIFEVLLRLARLGLGGPAAGGRQYVSWIHEQDFVRAVNWLIQHEQFAGPVNLAAPYPLPHRDFMAALRRAAGMPFGLPATRWMLELGALFLRTETELILKSRRVTPARLLHSGFTFTFPTWPTAALDLVTRIRHALPTAPPTRIPS